MATRRTEPDIAKLLDHPKEEDGVLVVTAGPPLLVRQQSIKGRNGRTLTLTLRTEPGKRRIVYDLFESPSKWREKRTIPKVEVPGSEAELSASGRIPMAAIIWAEEKFAEVWEDRTRKPDSGVEAPISQGTPIGLIFDEHRRGEYFKSADRKEQNSREQAMRIAETVLGRDFLVEHWDNNAMLRIKAKYLKGITVSVSGGPVRRYKAASSTTVRNIAAWLRTIFTAAQKIADPRDRRVRLVDAHKHPFNSVEMPKKGATKVVRNAHHDFMILYQYADQVDPSGRLRLMVVDARFTGHRLGTICATQRSEILLTAEEIAEALDRSLCVYVEDHEIRNVAEYYASRYGAIYRPWWKQKQGASENPEVTQFDRVCPLGPFHRAEIDWYLETHWNPLDLPKHAPLYPTDRNLMQPMYVDLPEKWYVEAVNLAQKHGEEIRRRSGVLWKGFRPMRRTELKRKPWKVHEKDIAFVGGWSINSYPDARDNTAMTDHYLGIDPDELFDAVCAGEGNEAPKHQGNATDLFDIAAAVMAS